MFDWVTWSIWAVGFAILVIWIIVPLKEFKEIVKSQHAAYKDRVAGENGGAAPTDERGGKDDA